MADQHPLNPASPAVRAHLTVLQGTIQRMAGRLFNRAEDSGRQPYRLRML